MWRKIQVFNREVFMLNGTESGTLSRANLFAWTFPKSYPPEKLVYHIEEPPKYGILSRKINGKSRRIGVSSNFTQAITSDSLSLATPDDSFFVFTLALAPIQGALILKSDSSRKALTTGMNFTTKDIAEERYTVSDGKHTVEGLLRIVASDPFVRLGESLLEYCCLPGDTPNLRTSLYFITGIRGPSISNADHEISAVSPLNLSIVSNLDIRLEDIVYQMESDNFAIQHHGSRRPTRTFTQKDINEGKISYNVGSAATEPFTVRVGNQSLTSEVQIVRRSLGASLELRRSATVSLPVGGVVSIDTSHLEIGDAASSADDLIYHVMKPPQEGTLVLERGEISNVVILTICDSCPVLWFSCCPATPIKSTLDNASSTPQVSARSFSQRDIDLGRLQYIHSASGAGRDTIQFNITSPHITKGPYTLYVEIYEHHVSLRASPLQVVAGGSTVVSNSVINVTSSDREDYVINVIEKPNYGWIVLDSWSVNNISSIGRTILMHIQCMHDATMMRSRNIQWIGSARTARRVCLGSRFKRHQRLVLCRRLHIASYLHPTADRRCYSVSEECPDGVFFLISRPSNGLVVNANDLSKSIYNFSQKDVDDSSVIFMRHPNASGSGGFSFLLSDGVHQIGPEWFSIEGWTSSSPVLQANARLLASPSASTVIGVESLRANIPNVGHSV
ncbi:hypothetical protein ANCCEY_08505 [Ancylostoma ceylanicum]|uniref:Uncharacterized protein n=1 Tax=Ancylostoma ceylanicum TaxID=53326 RepID=A0A0D6LMI5_9BILA|nr:hypothetical protein ANCCEY_08505 [Ancylostoma ceylanicum]